MTKPTSAVVFPDRTPTDSSIRTSQALREILTKNPTVENFTVKHIVDSLGCSRIGTSLMFFSIPGMVPVPGTSELVGIPMGSIAAQMIIGRTEIKLPKFILERSVPRRSLAVTIHAILPILEKAEKAVRPRWKWASHPTAQRILGVLIFVLALALSLPILEFDLPHAAAIFVISLGLVEQDGLVISIGVVVGLVSLALLSGAGRVLQSKARVWAKNLATKFGLKWATTCLKKLGFAWAGLLEFNLADLLLLWDPEASSRRCKGTIPRPNLVNEKQKGSAVRRHRERVRHSRLRAHLQAADRSSETARYTLSIQR